MAIRWLRLARRALRRSPRFLLGRVGRELARQGYRPWSRIRPAFLTEDALLRLAGAPSIDALWARQATSPFLADGADGEAWGRRFREAFPDASRDLVRAADAVCRHEFDLLGSGPISLGTRLPWHVDFKTGHRWPLRYACDLDPNDLDRPSDVKVPWELSRCQHFVTLGQAYALTGDERFAQEFVDQVTDWLDANPWGYGVNWMCPMDVALRALGWLWGFHLLARSTACAPPGFRLRFLRGLLLHGEFLAANLEVDDVNGNHYLVDGMGLVALGLFFRAAAKGRRWLERGRRIVLDAMQAQVHADGVDIEQSVAYHRLALEAFLTSGLLLRLYGEAPPSAFWDRLERMLEFVLAYTKPDGQAPLIGDADDGRIQKLGAQSATDHRYLLSTGAVLFQRGDFKQGAGRFWEESFWLLGPGGLEAFEKLAEPAARPGSHAFSESGFYVLRSVDAHLVVDCGEVGFRGLGGHGHNDVLSFELSLVGMNVVTDCGTYLYTASRAWRNRFRSTAFHSTVEVDGEELNRLADPDDLFRLRYDAVPAGVDWAPGAAWDRLQAGHRGYERLPAPVSHVRTFLLAREAPVVLVRDCLDGRGAHRLAWRFHLDPAIRAMLEGDALRLAGPARTVTLTILRRPADLALRLESGWVSRRYGVKETTTVVVAERTGSLPTEAVWAFAGHAPRPDERASWLAALEGGP
jgi:uncharacterized heparinase superfamily protein